MKTSLQWLVIAILCTIYLAALWAVLCPNVTSRYKAYFVDRTSSDWNPVRYAGRPEEGINFSQPGLPEWVDTTRGLSFRQTWGRWTDGNLAKIPAVLFVQPFKGPICMELTAGPAPSMAGKFFDIRMGDQTKTLQLGPNGYSRFRAPITLTQGADKLEFILPRRLPVERGTLDDRRVGLALVALRITPGGCPNDGFPP